MELIRSVAHLDSGSENSGNFHDYVAIAYNSSTRQYLLVNFTTLRGNGNPFSIRVKKKDFSALLRHDSEIEFGRPKELSESELKSLLKIAPNGRPYSCPPQLLERILAKIKEGTEMEKGIARKYSLL